MVDNKEVPLTEQYPHASKYITLEGLEKADKQTRDTWEFEAELCDRVVEVIGNQSCPWCKGNTWEIGDIIVDFRYPFVHGYRIQVFGANQSSWIVCHSCHLSKKLDKFSVKGGVATVTRTWPPILNLVDGNCPECKQAPCKHIAEAMFKAELPPEQSAQIKAMYNPMKHGGEK
jgi:hypothetical protein